MEYELDETDIELLNLSEEGKKYLEYHKLFNSKPFAYSHGMPDIDEQYGGLIGLYDECIKKKKTWEQLLGDDWDKMQD
ncbi:hypothetical protein ACFO0S_09675 [Chryseomicrobium palamuruense]|uniref:Uncharacterized protein n=1 Tax=Chryseomicrobium palamuruense TaxID=682973 RepID=A0ABV8UY16_9BACL